MSTSNIKMSNTTVLLILLSLILLPVITFSQPEKTLESFAKELAVINQPTKHKPPPLYQNLVKILNQEKLKYATLPDNQTVGHFVHLVEQLKPNFTIVFGYDDVYPGKKLNIMFPKQGPVDARLMTNKNGHITPLTFSPNMCGHPEDTAETRVCLDSLESMVDFTTEILESKVMPLVTTPAKWQDYTVSSQPTTVREEVVVCHKAEPPSESPCQSYAVYGCHYVPNSRVRMVALTGADGASLEAVTVCHMNTSTWNSELLSFKMMKAHPGPPVCHFMSLDDIVWVSD